MKKQIKEQIDKIKILAKTTLNDNGPFKASIALHPAELSLICDMATIGLEVIEVKNCKKHNQQYMDFLKQCPICAGEEIQIQNGDPEVIEQIKHKEKQRYKRRAKLMTNQTGPEPTAVRKKAVTKKKANKPKPKVKSFF